MSLKKTALGSSNLGNEVFRKMVIFSILLPNKMGYAYNVVRVRNEE